MADKGYSYLGASNRKNLESFEEDVLGRVCDLAGIPFAKDFSIFWGFGSFSVYRNRNYIVSILAASGNDFDFHNTAFVLDSLKSLGVTPNLIAHGLLDNVFPYIVLQTPMAMPCKQFDDREFFFKSAKINWSENKNEKMNQALELNKKFITGKEITLGRTLAAIHDTAKFPEDIKNKSTFLDLPESIYNLYPKLSELIQLCKLEYKKLEKSEFYIVSSLFFNPDMTLTNGELYMPVEWSSVSRLDARTEIGSVFLHFELSDFENYVASYIRECGLEFIKTNQIQQNDCLKMGAIFNFFQSLHYYSFSNEEKSFSKEVYKTKLRKAVQNVFSFAIQNKALENKLKVLMKF